jgi:hypothetical protein
MHPNCTRNVHHSKCLINKISSGPVAIGSGLCLDQAEALNYGPPMVDIYKLHTPLYIAVAALL